MNWGAIINGIALALIFAGSLWCFTVGALMLLCRGLVSTRRIVRVATLFSGVMTAAVALITRGTL